VVVETLRNGCGLTADRSGFLATSGEGEMVGMTGSGRARRKFDFLFDNHISRVG
jgi:uncharacterized protein